jgi:flagellar FliJ protein
MAQHLAIQTLIELANKDVNKFAKRLGLAVRNHQENEQKLTTLQQYRDDYTQRYQRGLTTGLSINDHHNFRVFLTKLEDAISGQQAIVQQALTAIEIERKAWQTAEQKRMSFDTLAQRAQRQTQLKTVRREQKLTDEHASRMLANRPHPYGPATGQK